MNRLTLLLGVNAAGDFKSKSMLTYYFETHRTLKNYAKSILPVLYKWNNKAWMIQHGLLSILSPWLRSTAQKEKKRFLSKYDCSLQMHFVNQEF